MKLIQLKIFRDIAYEKSFVKAAQMNFITQPSASAHLRLLEEELGVRLFDRVPRRVVLTSEGRLYLQHVEEILQKCNDLLALPGTLKDAPRGEVRVVSIHSVGMYELGTFLRSFMYQFPDIHIHLEYQDAHRVYELVKKKKADLGMVAFPETHASIQSVKFGSDRLALAVPANHHLANKNKVTVKDIKGEPFIAFDRSTPTRVHIDKFLKSYGIEASIKMTNNNIYALKKAIESGLGISIVPWKTVDDEVRNGTIKRISLGGKKLHRPLALLSLKGNNMSKVTEIFMKALIAHNNPGA